MAILADLGGTHARLAIWDGKSFSQPEKRMADEHPTFESALADYCARQGVKAGGLLLVATAAQRGGDGTWRFINNNQWAVSKAGLARAGWDARAIVNDFVGSARGAVTLAPGRGLVTLRGGTPDNESRRVVMGPGTGLGLAFMTPLPHMRWLVQETMGGHMLAACLTDEQFAVTRLVSKQNDRAVSFEDVCSGRGLPVLYRAVCMQEGIVPVHTDARGLIDHPDESPVKKTWRLFHEFLGLFAHHAVITGQGYGGVYFDGGVAQRLHTNNMLDFATVAKFMDVPTVGIVRQRVAETPVWLVNDPYVALHGLGAMAAEIEKDAA